MILFFPSLDAIRLAVTSGVVPTTITLAPALAGTDDHGGVWVQPTAAPGRPVLADLGRFGVQPVKAAPVPLALKAANWLQIIPLERDPAATRHPATETGAAGDKTPVLFELPEAQLTEVVGEILRLGNDRQGFRPVTVADQARVLLRVIDPPYYTLLRALDQGSGQTPGASAGPAGIRAYVERASRVWCQLGSTHPLADQIQPPPAKILLLRPPNDWALLDEGRFRDIYEIIEFKLPDAPAAWKPGELENRLTVPLRLARGSQTDQAELWVLHERGLEQLDALVHEADDQLLSRLAFAVGTSGGRTVMVVRVRPSRLSPPVLVLDGIGFRTFLKLPNLFMPCGWRLHPPLRRDAVSALLGKDAGVVCWLYPRDDGRFVPETIPEDAFRPLDQWVDFILEREHEPLDRWVRAARFDFAPFVCRDDTAEPRPKDTERERTRGKKPREQADDPAQETARASAAATVKAKQAKTSEPVAEPVPRTPSETQKELRAVETRFLALTGPLDAPERQHLWEQMAVLNASLDQPHDSTVCWLNSLWDRDAVPPATLNRWYRSESRQGPGGPLGGADLDSILNHPSPHPVDLRMLTAYLVSAAAAPPAPAALTDRLGRLHQFLETHESQMPVRAVWLAWSAVVSMSQGDVLALARARDRLLERLYQRGLSPDLDLPGFLRFSGLQASERFRGVRDYLVNLQPRGRKWVGEDFKPGARTPAYTELMFAYGLARIGETNTADKLLASAQDDLVGKDLVHRWLYDAFEFRVRQAAEGKPTAGRLPDELLGQLAYLRQALEKKEGDTNKPRMQLLAIDRLRQFSRILEPHEKIDAYRSWHGKYADEISQQLASLSDLNDRAELLNRLSILLQNPQKKKRTETVEGRILAQALQLAPRLGESFAREALGRVGPLLQRQLETPLRAELLEKGLFLAAHFDQGGRVRELLGGFQQLLSGQSGTALVGTMDSLLGESFRSLRKLGMRDEIGLLLSQMAQTLLGGQKVTDFAARQEAFLSGGGTIDVWLTIVKTLLQVAGGWYFFGQDARAKPVLDEARTLLFQGDLIPVYQTHLACAYVQTLGQAPLDFACSRLEELFRRVERIQDSFTTNDYYSLSKLRLVETVIMALVSEDTALDKAGRRWLDDDEFLVRRRIHRDVREAMTRAGL